MIVKTLCVSYSGVYGAMTSVYFLQFCEKNLRKSRLNNRHLTDDSFRFMGLLLYPWYLVEYFLVLSHNFLRNKPERERLTLQQSL